MNCLIRPATAADAQALAELRYEFRAALSMPTEDESTFTARCQSWMASRLHGDAGWWAWVAVLPTGIAGTIWLHRIEKIPNPGAEVEAHGYITNLFVRPHVRGAGVGSRLLEAALNLAEDEQLDTIILWPTPRSRSLYQRRGFAAHDDIFARSARLQR